MSVVTLERRARVEQLRNARGKSAAPFLEAARVQRDGQLANRERISLFRTRPFTLMKVESEISQPDIMSSRS